MGWLFYTALRARLEAVEKELIEEQRISTLRGNMIEFELMPALHHAEAALTIARRDALEEAAGLTPYDCDGNPAGQFDNHVFVKRDAIRALITQEESKL